MAARSGVSQVYSLTRDRWILDGSVTGGGAAANCTGVKGTAIASVNYNAATGKYLITLKDAWAGFLGMNLSFEGGTRQFTWAIDSEAVATTKTIAIRIFASASGVAPALADLLSTEVMNIQVYVTNSVQSPKPY